MGAEAFARTAGLSKEKAEDFIEEYFLIFPELKLGRKKLGLKPEISVMLKILTAGVVGFWKWLRRLCLPDRRVCLLGRRVCLLVRQAYLPVRQACLPAGRLHIYRLELNELPSICRFRA